MFESYNELGPEQLSELRKIRIEETKNRPKEKAKECFKKIDELGNNLVKLIQERNYEDSTLAVLTELFASVGNLNNYFNDSVLDLSKFEAEKENVFSTAETLKKYVEENEKDIDVLEEINNLIKSIKVEVLHMILDLERDLEIMEKEMLKWKEDL